MLHDDRWKKASKQTKKSERLTYSRIAIGRGGKWAMGSLEEELR